MHKNDLVYVAHMLELARKAVAKVIGLDRPAFDADEDLRLALTHIVQTLGEAARRVSPQTQSRYPDVPWKLIVGMRHKIVHDYMTVDEDILWQVVTRQLEPLVQTLTRIVPPELA